MSRRAGWLALAFCALIALAALAVVGTEILR